MLIVKYVLCFASLMMPHHLALAAEQQVVKPTGSVPIRFSPPSPWLLGFPGWKVAETESSEQYALLRTLKIRAFSSTQTWAEVRLDSTNDDSKKGWVYWGESLDDDENFKIRKRKESPQNTEGNSRGRQP